MTGKKEKRMKSVTAAEVATSSRKQDFLPGNAGHRGKERGLLNAASGPPGARKRSRKAVAFCHAEDVMADSHAITKALMNASEDAVFVVDGDLIILDTNVTACERLGVARDLMLGYSLCEFIPAWKTTEKKEAVEKARQLLEIIRFEDEMGGRRCANVIYPVLDSIGWIINRFVIISQDIGEQETEESLSEDSWFRMIVERASDMIAISTFSAPPHYVYANPSHTQVLGYKAEDLIDKSPFDFIHPEDLERLIPILERYLTAKQKGLLIRGGGRPTERLMYRFKDIRGKWRHLEGTADLLGDEHILMVARDMTRWVKSNEELEKAKNELKTNVTRYSKDLKMKAKKIEEMNISLKVLLDSRERERKDSERNIILLVNRAIKPYVQKLENSGLNKTQRAYLDVLASGIERIVSMTSEGVIIPESNLTPSQANIANLVAAGKSSKEIADILCLSIKTVETHRRQIRAKLGIHSRQTNLQCHLQQRITP